MRHPELLYATTNPGKLAEVESFLSAETVVRSPHEYGIALEVAETGETLEENAELKARAHRAVAPAEVIIMADDTGLEIDALDGEPGVKVRRWLDGETEATDQQIVEYCLTRMKDVPADERGAQFRTVIVLSLPDGSERTFDGILRGQIETEVHPVHQTPGLPFRGLFYVPEVGRFLGELEEAPGELLTHRQLAVRQAVDWLTDYNKDA